MIPKQMKKKNVLKEIKRINLNNISPLEALNLLNELQKQLKWLGESQWVK